MSIQLNFFKFKLKILKISAVEGCRGDFHLSDGSNGIKHYYYGFFPYLRSWLVMRAVFAHVNVSIKGNIQPNPVYKNTPPFCVIVTWKKKRVFSKKSIMQHIENVQKRYYCNHQSLHFHQVSLKNYFFSKRYKHFFYLINFLNNWHRVGLASFVWISSTTFVSDFFYTA